VEPMHAAQKPLLLTLMLVYFVAPSPATAMVLRVPQDLPTISAAIATAASGDTIRVAAGTYSAASNGEAFPLTLTTPGLVLQGAGMEASVLDANGSASVLVCSASGSGRVSGFTITGGSAALGGGVLVTDGSPELDHVRFEHNGASVGGGSLSTLGSPAPWIHHNVFVDSYSTSGVDVHALRLNGRTAGRFEHNLVAHSDGNGLLTVDSVTTEVRNNIFFRNGIPSPPRGRGICWISDLPANVHHNLFFENQVAAMFWSSGGGDFGAAAANDYSLADGVFANLEADPRFVDAAAGDYHLLAVSPAIDAGDPAAALDPDGTRADIGPFAFAQVTEVAPGPALPVRVWPSPARGPVEVAFTLARRSAVRITVLDSGGRLVRRLVDGAHEPGSVRVAWDGRDAGGRASPPGLYLVAIEAEGARTTRRVALLR
jgi:hypothetical protein